MTEPRRWLIAYDVRDERRLAAVHRYLKGAAVPVQYSVFAARASAAEIARVVAALNGLIDARVDDVRIYGIPRNSFVYTLGASILPADAWLLDNEVPLAPIIRSAAPASQRRARGTS